MKIYNSGYTTGFKVARNEDNGVGTGRRQDGFYTYGFKAFAAERVPDTMKAKKMAKLRSLSDRKSS